MNSDNRINQWYVDCVIIWAKKGDRHDKNN